MRRLLLGLDIGSSSVKAALISTDSGKVVAAAQSPTEEMAIDAPQSGWAEQHPDLWWQHTCTAIQKSLLKAEANPTEIVAIGVAYQMHSLVAIDKSGKPVRPSIIWCDSRAVAIGDKAFKSLGEHYCLTNFLNSPGNFTASKLKWVKENEPAVYSRITKFMLPGDYIAFRLTGEISTSDTGLSEGMLWDYQKKGVAKSLLDHYGIDPSLTAEVRPVFSITGQVNKQGASEAGLIEGIPVSYRAGDQPNNAFSLNVLNPGETAATAGTSGVIYSVTDQNAFDPKSRVNAFIHVNNKPEAIRNGILLCVNGTGILNSWIRKNFTSTTPIEYQHMNELAAKVKAGSEGLLMLPFGNGAERILENKVLQASWHGLDLNRHTQAHVFRAAQEGIVFALMYGFEILQAMKVNTKVIRAGHANMFLSPVFRRAFVNTIGVDLELYDTDGAKGAALGAGVGAGIYSSFTEAFEGLKLLHAEQPDASLQKEYSETYSHWKTILKNSL